MTKSSKEQLKDELDQMYKQMTDPAEIEKAKRKKEREQRLKEMKSDYGLA